MISARHSTNRQSFEKVTCPFNAHLTLLQTLILENKPRQRYTAHQFIFSEKKWVNQFYTDTQSNAADRHICADCTGK